MKQFLLVIVIIALGLGRSNLKHETRLKGANSKQRLKGANLKQQLKGANLKLFKPETKF